ncbi:MAG: Rab family GTPase [Candidatus Helarchaeota archaeon]
MSSVRFRFKLVLIGEGAVGKTSIRQKYMGKGFTGEYLKTIGADFASKTVELPDAMGETIKSIFQIWDLAGQQEFKEVRASFYGGCQGVLLVFDLTRKITMDKLKDWILEAAKNAGGSIKAFYLIGNKCDLPNREVTEQDGQQFAKFLSERLKFSIPYIETSAKTGEHIDYLFLDLCRNLLIKEGLDIPPLPKEEKLPSSPPSESTITSESSEIAAPPKPPKVPEISNSVEISESFPPPEPIEAPEFSPSPETPINLEIPEIPPPSSVTDTDLIERIKNLEERVKTLEDLLKKIAKILNSL